MDLNDRNRFLFRRNCTQSFCFCEQCRQNKVERYAAMPIYDMYKYISVLGNVREIGSERVFTTTLQQIANGKAYYDACMSRTRLKQWKSWAKKQDVFKRLPKTMLSRLANYVNDCRVCYERWDDIVRNLSDPMFSNIDASTLSVNHLRRASGRNWCIQQNESLRVARAVQRGDPFYSPARYQEILQMVVNTGIIGELQHNPSYVASFFGRIQSDAIAIARRTSSN